MSDFASDPPRWRDRTGQANLTERIAGRLIRSMGAPPTFAQPQPAWIDAEDRRRPALLKWWPAMAVALLASGATFALAARMNLLPGWLRPAPASPISVAPGRPSRSLRPVLSRRIAPTAGVEAMPSMQVASSVANQPQAPASLAILEKPRPQERRRQADVPASAAKPTVEPASVTGFVPPAPAPVVPAVTSSKPQPASGPRSEGPRWLAESIRTLRAEHNPESALALLDDHAAVLNQSALAHETMLLRVEALLALRRSDEVLRLLDSRSLDNVPASRTLLLARAQLRAAAGRCSDSLADYDLILARAHLRDEQALFGRAVCRSQTGDRSGANADFELYQRQFPSGPHIHEVEKRLSAAAK